jgi:uncharacterized membrane protein YecN with MAPEG domain
MQTTLLTAGLLGLIFIALSIRVIKVRGSTKVMLATAATRRCSAASAATPTSPNMCRSC